MSARSKYAQLQADPSQAAAGFDGSRADHLLLDTHRAGGGPDDFLGNFINAEAVEYRKTLATLQAEQQGA